MKRCVRCLMPDSRPGIRFIGDVCQGCLNHDAQSTVNWGERLRELRGLLEGKKVAVAVSGGKDSYFLTHLATKVLGLDVTLVRVGDWFGSWPGHEHNLRNLQVVFRALFVECRINRESFRAMCRAGFEETGNLGFYDTIIYAGAMSTAQRMGCTHVLFGEDSAHQYGCTIVERKAVDESSLMQPHWRYAGLMNTKYLEGPKAKGIYTSYYVPWSGYSNYQLAKSYGFHTTIPRLGFLENYTAQDGIGWAVSCHWKYLKFGFGRVTDEVSWSIRDGRMTVEEGKEAIEGKDGHLDKRVLDDFLRVAGYTQMEYDKILKGATWLPTK